MRFFIGHRLPLGFYGGLSVPFYASRILIQHGSAPAEGPVERGLGYGIILGFAAILIGAYFSLR